MSDRSEAEQVVYESAGRMMLHAIQHRDENLAELFKLLGACETMERGLPKIVATAEETNEGIEQSRNLALAEIAAAPPMVPPDVRAKLEAAINSVTDLAALQMRSLRALAKTQLVLAKGVRHLTTMQVIYLSGDSYTTDAAQAANRLGRGEEALQEMLQQKLKETE